MVHDDEARKATAAEALLAWGNSNTDSTSLSHSRPQPRSTKTKGNQELDIADAKSENPTPKHFPNNAEATRNSPGQLSIDSMSVAKPHTSTSTTTNSKPNTTTPAVSRPIDKPHAQQQQTTAEPQPQPPIHSQQKLQEQQHYLHHHLIDVNSMLSMTSIGFGIDSSPNAGLGDATDAAIKAVQDAMDRSSLRLPIVSPAHSLLQIKVKLGVPARRGGTDEPMTVNVSRLSAILPGVIPILPISVQVGGLYLASESQGSPSICTAVASITLQSQTTALPIHVPSSEMQMAQPHSSKASHVNAEGTAIPRTMHGWNGQQQEPLGQDDVSKASAAHPPVSSRLVSLRGPPSLQHFTHLAAAPATSPSVPKNSNADEDPTTLQADFGVHRSNSMEMLAMISEGIRNSSAGNLQLHTTAAASAASISVGLATAALQGAQKQNINTLEAAGHIRNDSGGPLTVPKSRDSGDDGDNQSMIGGIVNCNYKKLPPGVTTKNNQRLFVKHQYRDYSMETPGRWETDPSNTLNPKGSIKLAAPAFPVKLHQTLSVIERDGFSDIIGWLPHGRSFKIHKQKEFSEIILPRYDLVVTTLGMNPCLNGVHLISRFSLHVHRYFIMTKKSSFLRQLNLYSFNRFSAGPDQGVSAC